MERVPDIEEIILAKREGRAARTSTICSYDTGGDIVAIQIVVPPVSARTSAAYQSERDLYFLRFPGSVRDVPGVGEDAWLSGGNTLHVLAGTMGHFIVTTRMAQPSSSEIVLAVAKVVLSKLYR